MSEALNDPPRQGGTFVYPAFYERFFETLRRPVVEFIADMQGIIGSFNRCRDAICSMRDAILGDTLTRARAEDITDWVLGDPSEIPRTTWIAEALDASRDDIVEIFHQAIESGDLVPSEPTTNQIGQDNEPRAIPLPDLPRRARPDLGPGAEWVSFR